MSFPWGASPPIERHLHSDLGRLSGVSMQTHAAFATCSSAHGLDRSTPQRPLTVSFSTRLGQVP